MGKIIDKNINLALITIGNCNWKKIIEDLWSSLDINEEGYKLMRAYDCYFAKLDIENTDLPCYLTNYDLHILHINNEYLFRLIIAPPVISNYEKNKDLVWFPYWDKDIEYGIGSKECCEKVIGNTECDNIIILLGDNLYKEEIMSRHKITQLCVDNNKTFWEISNSCKCMNVGMIVKWIKSGENYCGYHNKDTVRISMGSKESCLIS